MRIVRLLPLSFFVLLLGGATAAAHLGGTFYEETVGEYVIDIGYEPGEPRTDSVLVLDFSLLHAADRTPADFSHVWVRLEQEEKTLVATGVGRSALGATTFLYKTGDTAAPITVHARFEEGTATLAEASFSIPVMPAEEGMPPWVVLLIAGLAGVAAGAAGVLYWQRRK